MSKITHFVITYAKTHFPITDEQNEILRGLSPDDEIDLDGSYVRIKNIAEILSESKYYETYPDRRPPETQNVFQEQYGDINKQIRQPTQRAKELMKQGFLRGYMKTWGGSQENAEKRFHETVLNGPMDNKIYHRKTVEKYKDRTDLTTSEKGHYEFALEKLGQKV